MDFGVHIEARIHRKSFRGWEKKFLYFGGSNSSLKIITQESHDNTILSISYLNPRILF
jgi:hypothetical protein